MVRESSTKEFYIGSLSLPIATFAIMFSFTSLGNGPFGKVILNTLRIPVPYGLISLFLLCVSLFIGNKYKHYRLARFGRNVSLFFLLLMIAYVILSIVYKN